MFLALVAVPLVITGKKLFLTELPEAGIKIKNLLFGFREFLFPIIVVGPKSLSVRLTLCINHDLKYQIPGVSEHVV